MAPKSRRAIAIVTSKGCFGPGTSIFVHRLTDKTNAPAGLMAFRRYILLLALFASQKKEHPKRQKTNGKGLIGHRASQGATIYQSMPEISFPNLVTVGRNFD
jgi:hypothetical protein